jgi:serine/threonine protein kinase
VLAYELLTGRLPYKAKSVGDLVYQQSSSTPARTKDLRKDLPRAWDELIHTAISLDPAARPPCAQEMARRMMVATPRGEEIARATASLLFTSLSESTSFPGAEDVEEDEVQSGDGEGDNAPLSRTVSVPLEGFLPRDVRSVQRGTNSFERIKTGSTFGIPASGAWAPISPPSRLFAVVSALMVVGLAVGLVQWSGASFATAKSVDDSPFWSGDKADGRESADHKPSDVTAPTPRIFGPELPPRLVDMQAGSRASKPVERRPVPPTTDFTSVQKPPADPNELFKDRN